MTSEPATTTHVNQLRLTNFRLFGELDIDFHPELTVLVGPNGGGKTAVLDALALALRPFVDPMDGRSQAKGIARSDIRRVVGPDGHPQLTPPVQIDLDATILDTRLRYLSRSLKSEKGKTTTAESRALRTLNERLYGGVIDFASGKRATRPELPVVAYYGTGRLWSVGRLTALKKGDKDPTPNSPTRGYAEALSANSHYQLFADWFMRISREIGSWTGSLPPDGPKPLERMRGAVRGAVEVVLAPTHWSGPSPDWTEETLYMQHADGRRLPVDFLSDGIRTMVGLAGDLAHRCARLNPDFGEAAAEKTQGIVLIDEVDMHLHPEWQQVVLGSLRKAFPRLQFIVTTHSPQVLSTVAGKHVRILSQHEGRWYATQPDQSPLGRSSADALARVQGVDPRPPLPIQDDIGRYEQLVRSGKEQDTAAADLKRRLDEAGVEVPEADLATWRFLASRRAGADRG